MNNQPEPSFTINTPSEIDFSQQGLSGTMQQILSENIGEFVVCTFLIGTGELVERYGFIYSVGRNYVVLYSPIVRQYDVCDIFSIKFVRFYPPDERPATVVRSEQFLADMPGTAAEAQPTPPAQNQGMPAGARRVHYRRV